MAEREAGSSFQRQQQKTSLKSNNKLDELLRRQYANFKAFVRTAANINVELITEKWEFEDALKSLTARWSAIDQLHWEIESELEEENKTYSNIFDRHEQEFLHLKKAINTKMWSVQHREKSTPQLDIPFFNGNHHQWVSFKDLFIEVIHSNPSLSNGQKMQHLKSRVRGEAEKLIQHLQISTDNYLVCWDILTRRYDNKKLIFTSHMNILLGLPNIQQQAAQQLKRMHDTTIECMNAIKNLGIDITSWDPMIVHILSQKLDADSYSDYVSSLKNAKDLPILNDFLQFLEIKFTALETARRRQDSGTPRPTMSNNYPHPSSSIRKQHYNNSFKNSNNYNTNGSENRSLAKSMHVSNIKCPLCNNQHGIYNCKSFLIMNDEQKVKTANNLKLCTNCLFSHNGNPCTSTQTCRKCLQQHNTILHEAFMKTASSTNLPSSEYVAQQTTGHSPITGTSHASQGENSEVLLATALVRVKTSDGSYNNMRALIDQGSQITLITERAAQSLGIKRQRCQGVVFGVGEKENSCKGRITIECASMYNDYKFQSEALIMNDLIKSLPNKTFGKPSWSHLQNIQLADPEFYNSRSVDLLLGADVYANIILGGVIKGDSAHQPIAQQTQLGWLLCGGVKTFQCNVVLNNIENIHKFEEIAEKSHLSEEEQQRLPSKHETIHELELSKPVAITQPQNIESKCEKQEAYEKTNKKIQQHTVLVAARSKLVPDRKTLTLRIELSRTQSLTKRLKHPLWWQGPSWLQSFSIERKQEQPIYKTEEEEKKTTTLDNIIQQTNKQTNNNIIDLLQKHRTIKKVTRVACIVRTLTPIPQHQHLPNYLTINKPSKAKTVIREHVQRTAVRTEIEHINKHNKATANNIIHETKDKKQARKTTPRSSSYIIMALLFFMSLFVGSIGAYNITNLKNNQSLYFDPVSKVSLVKDMWTLVVFYDMSPYWEGMQAFDKTITYLERTCKTINTEQCNMILSQLNHEGSELKYYNELLMTQHSNDRQRRGLINGVGYVANSLFGVLDEHFAEQYSQDIALIRRNEKHLVSLWRNQTSIVESEYNLLKRTEEIMSKQHKIINKHLMTLDKMSNILQHEINNITLLQEFTLTSLTASNLLHNLKRTQDVLLDILTNVHHGQFNIHLLTPEQLRRELSIISTHLSEDITLPINQENISKLYALLNIKARITEEYFIFQITFPLISRDRYKLYKILSIPQQIDNTMIEFIPSSEYIATDLKRDSYLTFSSKELSQCNQQEDELICNLKKPIYHLNSNNNFCDIDRNTEKCKIKKSKCENKWTPLTDPSLYLYYCCNSCMVKVICGEQVQVMDLKKAGIIYLEQNCLLKGSDFTLHIQRNSKNILKLTADIYAPKVDQLNNIINSTIPFYNNSSFQTESKELEYALQKLHQRIDVIKNSQAVVEGSLSSHDVHQYAVSYTLVSAGALAAGVLLCRRWRSSARRALITTDIELQPVRSVSEVNVSASARPNMADRQPSARHIYGVINNGVNNSRSPQHNSVNI